MIPFSANAVNPIDQMSKTELREAIFTRLARHLARYPTASTSERHLIRRQVLYLKRTQIFQSLPPMEQERWRFNV